MKSGATTKISNNKTSATDTAAPPAGGAELPGQVPEMEPQQAARLKRLKKSIFRRFPRDRTPKRELLEKAFRDAEFHHRPQARKSGEPFIFHPARVALMAAEAGMDLEAVIIALLHDVIEDTGVTKEEMGAEYGEWLAEVVDGLTKAKTSKRRKYSRPVAVETFRKLISSTIKDLRTLQVKILDRLDNMRDLGYLARLKQRRISTETMNVYVPLAHRLGMQDISDELAALSFRYLYPKRFQKGLVRLKRRIKESAAQIESVRGLLESRLKQARSLRFELTPKYLQISDFVYNQKPGEQVLAGFKVRVPQAADCYRAMGALHMAFRVVPNSIRDFISNPKPNRYQALCSEIFLGTEPTVIEVISEEMERVNAMGILAGGAENHEELYRYYQSYLELLDIYSDTEDLRMEDVLRHAQMDTLQLFTPRGEPLTFPTGATVLDFAFAIHSDIGARCDGAHMAGRRVSRIEELQDGAMVEILTNPGVAPRLAWIDHVRTTRAKLAIRRDLKAQANTRAQEVGRKLFSAELNLLALDSAQMADAPEFQTALENRKLTLPQFFQQVGNDTLSIRAFLVDSGLVEIGRVKRLESQQGSLLARYLRPMFGAPDPVLKIGFPEDAFFHMAPCCHPLPGDSITGVRGSDGITVHRTGCAELERFAADTLHSLGWEQARGAEAWRLDVLLIQDQPGLLYKVSKVMRDCKVNIVDLGLRRDPRTGGAAIRVELEPISQKVFRTVVSRLRAIKEVEKIVPVSRSQEQNS